MMGGATADPIAAPVLAMPMPNARCLAENHAAMVRVARGQFPDSPTPRKLRITVKLIRPEASACAISAIDHHEIAAAKPSRLPNRSKTAPQIHIDSEYVNRNQVPTQAYCRLVSPKFCWSTGARTDTVWRSM